MITHGFAVLQDGTVVAVEIVAIRDEGAVYTTCGRLFFKGDFAVCRRNLHKIIQRKIRRNIKRIKRLERMNRKLAAAEGAIKGLS